MTILVYLCMEERCLFLLREKRQKGNLLEAKTSERQLDPVSLQDQQMTCQWERSKQKTCTDGSHCESK